MEVEDAKAQIRQLTVEWIEQRLLADSATRQATALQKIIQGYVEMFPGLQEEVDAVTSGEGPPMEGDDGRPRGAEAVRRVLHDAPTVWWLVSELIAVLRGRDWLPESDNPANAVRAALERLVSDPESDVVKARDGSKVKYSYQPDRDEPPPESEGDGYDFGEEPF